MVASWEGDILKKQRVIYYSDPLRDDFAKNEIQAIRVGKDYCYIHRSFLWRAASFLLYYVIAIPIIWIISKVYMGLKIENRKVLRGLRGKGYFLYGNHTRELDAFVSPMVTYPGKSYVIAGAEAVSLPCLKNIIMRLGVLPIPTELSGMKNFYSAVEVRAEEGHGITVYPEAHIWPFYTGIRPFADTSFRYPVKKQLPAVAMVATYRKRSGLFRFLKRPGMTITLSDPVYSDAELTVKKAQKNLRDKIYDRMVQISNEKEQVEYIRYEYVPKGTD